MRKYLGIVTLVTGILLIIAGIFCNSDVKFWMIIAGAGILLANFSYGKEKEKEE